jgi:hypothetical protein
MAVLLILAAVVLAITVWRRFFSKPTNQIPPGLKALPGPKGMYLRVWSAFLDADVTKAFQLSDQLRIFQKNSTGSSLPTGGNNMDQFTKSTSQVIIMSGFPVMRLLGISFPRRLPYIQIAHTSPL